MTYAQRCIQTYQAPWGSFILDRIYFTHTSKYSYITIWVCTSHIYTPYVVVEVVRWRTCGGSKKNITRQKHHKNCKHQTTWIHCAKMIDSRSFTFLCADRGIRIWHSSLVVRWVAWPKKLHMVALPRFGLHWPYDSPKGVFCFRGGWVGETKQSCATCATIARFPPTLLTRDVKQKMSIHHLRLTCIVSLVNRYYTDMSHWHLSISLVYLFPFVQHIFFFEKHPQKLRAHAKHKRTHAFHIQTRKEQRELLLQSALLET